MRIARLDGLRALAILSVIAAHCMIFPGFGWAGVDLFFVLSGFLITNILRRTREAPSYWSSFYLKRAVRILPPLPILFVVTALLTRHRSVIGFLGYALFLGNVVNFTPYVIGSLSAMWSLAVEEHFYLLWPIAVRRLDKNRLIRILALVILIEPILRGVVTPYTNGHGFIYETTIFRLDPLAGGALLALLYEGETFRTWFARWSGRIALGSAAALLLATGIFPSFAREKNSVEFNSIGYSVVVCFFFFFVGWVVAREEGIACRVLSAPPLRFIGRISYGMYLYHYAVFTGLKRLLHIPFTASGNAATQKMFPLELAVTIAVATMSFMWVEKPFMEWGARVASSLGKTRSEQRDATYQVAPATRRPRNRTGAEEEAV